jgi:hypothetical protein
MFDHYFSKYIIYFVVPAFVYLWLYIKIIPTSAVDY